MILVRVPVAGCFFSFPFFSFFPLFFFFFFFFFFFWCPSVTGLLLSLRIKHRLSSIWDMSFRHWDESHMTGLCSDHWLILQSLSGGLININLTVYSETDDRSS